MKSNIKLCAGAVALGLSLSAVAATAMQFPLPQSKTENGISYLSGGIGKPEAAALKEEARHYPLSLVFSAAKDNEFVADVRVTIKNQAGKEILNTDTYVAAVTRAEPSAAAARR